MTVGCLLARGFDDLAFRIPFERLRSFGIRVAVIGVHRGAEFSGRRAEESVRVVAGIDHARRLEWDGLYIPGGRSASRLRSDPRIVAFVREVFRTGKPIGAIAEGARLLSSAGVLRGRQMTASQAVHDELRAAGAVVLDRCVVVDGNLLTSRSSDEEDLEAFTTAFLTALGIGPAARAMDVISVQPSG